jgi:spore coat polysaccharide biosynthesis protein SpsF (cytidylyltransferase family)
MFRTLGIVEVPPRNSPGNRLVNALAARRLGGKPLLEWVVRRVTESMLLEQVVIVAAGRDHARALASSVPGDVAIFPATDCWDPLGRFAAALREYGAEAAIRVQVDHPFVDPALIDRLIAKAESYRQCDWLSYSSSRGASTLLAKVGVLAEWFRAAAVEQVDALALRDEERQDVSRFIQAHPERFHMRLLPLPERLDRDDLRLIVAGEEDWDHAQVILDALGPDHLDWQEIARLLDAHPALRRRMALLNEDACCRLAPTS